MIPPRRRTTAVHSEGKARASAKLYAGALVGRLEAGKSEQYERVAPGQRTVVGVMPEGFSFPVSHQAWVPLPLRASGYAPLEGGAISVFGRLAPGVSHREAAAELTTLAARATVASPQTHAHFRVDLNPYGRGWFKRSQASSNELFEYAATHLPILLVLIVACTTVGTLVYARTATREAEIAVRSALGAGRRRIVMQLFVEALVLASLAAVVGLAAAHWALKWGVATLFSVRDGGPPFWMHSGLRLTTVLYAAGLAVVAAGILGILPALRATGSHVQGHLRNMGSGGSTLRFGGVWTTAMILQVAVTVVCIPLAINGSEETVRDRIIRGRFPAGEYLSVPMELDRASGPAEETESAFAERLERIYGEFERRVGQEPGVSPSRSPTGCRA